MANETPQDRTVRILALQLSLRVFLGGLATAVLVAVEYQKLTMLDMPVSAALVSFDAIIATISNAGTAVIMASIFLLLFFLVAGTIVVAFLFVASLRLAVVALIASTPAGFMNLLRFLLTLPASARLLLRPAQAHDISTDALRQRYASMFPRLGTAQSTASSFSQRALTKQLKGLAKCWTRAKRRFRGFSDIFLTASDTSRRAQSLRWGLLFVVLLGVFFFSRVAIHHQERQMYATADLVKKCCPARPIVDPVARYLAGWFDSGLGQVVVTPFELGSVTYDRAEIATASHLRPFPPRDDQVANANNLRRERVFYIGDFGDWAYLARARNPDHRLMVRKSKVVEFARYDPDDYHPSKPPQTAKATPTESHLAPKIDLGNRLAMTLRLSIWGNRWTSTDTQTPALETLTARVALLEAWLDKIDTLPASSDLDALRSGTVALRDDLRRMERDQTALITRLGGIEAELPGLRRMRAQADWIAVAQARLSDRLTQGTTARALLDTRITRLDRTQDQQAQTLAGLDTRLSNATDDIAGLETGIDAATTRNAALTTRLDQQAADNSRRDDTLHRTAAALADQGQRLSDLHRALARDTAAQSARLDGHDHQIAALVTALGTPPDRTTEASLLIALKTAITEAFPENLGTTIEDGLTRSLAAALPGEIRQAIQDGLSTRPTGTLNDLHRRFGADYIDSCTNSGSDPLWHVAFGEGRATSTDTDTLDRIAGHLRHDSDTPQIVVLRGGASFTGQPEANIQLSETRAEWVKTALLRRLMGPGAPAALADRARDTRALQIAAIGLGERMGSPMKGVSPRDVEVFLCDPATGRPRTLEDRIAAKN